MVAQSLGSSGSATGGQVDFQWYGDVFATYERRAVRAALKQAGEQMVDIAEGLVNVDTHALQHSIRYELPASERGSDAYQLMFGVWDHPDNELRVKGNIIENPVEYAYFQETQPYPIGSPFLQPAIDAIALQIDDYIRSYMPRLDARGRLTFSAGFTGFGESDDDGG